MKFTDSNGRKFYKTTHTSIVCSEHISRLTEHGPLLRSTDDYRNPINYKLRHLLCRSKSPGSVCQICSGARFLFVSTKVDQRGACRHDSVVLPYISVLLTMNFTTPEIPFQQSELLLLCNFLYSHRSMTYHFLSPQS